MGGDEAAHKEELWQCHERGAQLFKDVMHAGIIGEQMEAGI